MKCIELDQLYTMHKLAYRKIDQISISATLQSYDFLNVAQANIVATNYKPLCHTFMFCHITAVHELNISSLFRTFAVV